jgi:hypothetical protein
MYNSILSRWCPYLHKGVSTSPTHFAYLSPTLSVSTIRQNFLPLTVLSIVVRAVPGMERPLINIFRKNEG